MPDLFNQTIEDELTLVSSSSDSQANNPANQLVGDSFLNPKSKAKELGQQINWVITQRKIEYLSDLLSLKTHPSVQIRRKVADGLSAISSKDILYEVEEWQKIEPDRQTWLILESLIDKIQRGVSGNDLAKDVKILSVSEALGLVKKLLGEGSYTIEGELTEVRPVREFYYFGLKDSQDARLDCFCLGRVVQRARFGLNDGLNLRLEGKFKLGKNSRLVFDVTSIKLTGEGELLRNLKVLQEKLTKEGIFDPQRKRLVPRFPKNILLIASPNSAAISDFQKVLGQRRKGVNIYLLPIKTQGVGSEYDILEKLQATQNLIHKYQIDVIVMTRGGGSSDDLFVFNSEKIVRAVHALSKPTIVAIGHERDITLVELVADLRASTPSNAAELVSISGNEIAQQTHSTFQQLISLLHTKVSEYQGAGERMILIAVSKINTEIASIRGQIHQNDKAFSYRLGDIKREVGQLWSNLRQALRLRLDQNRRGLIDLKLVSLQALNQVETTKVALSRTKSEIKQNLNTNLELIRSQFESTKKQIQLSDPKNILDKGFVMVSSHQMVIEDGQELVIGQSIELEFRDGKRSAEIQK